MSETIGDYSSSLSNELNIANMTQANAAKQAADLAASNALYNTTGALGPDDQPITVGKGNNFNTDNILAYNSPAGNSSLANYTPTGSLPSGFDLAALTKFLGDNKGLITAGGAALGLMGANNAQTTPTGYQGGIPNLSATRNMITAPPTRAEGYRPGQGGINYGGDVTYSRLPSGTDPWANLSGNSGRVTGLTTGLPAGVATAITNLTGNKTNTVTGAAGNDTIKGATGNDTITKPDTRSAAMQYAENSGMGAQQYLGNINQWILDHPYASKAQISDAMKQYGVSDVDLQTALGESNFSDATKYGLTHGMGLQEMNFNINDWIQAHPYATNAQIQAEQTKYGVNDEDVARALTALNSSAGKEYAIVHDMGLDQLYKNILDYQRAGHTEQEIADAMAQYGISNADVKAAQNFSKATGYAEGGMAKGRYLQGETDGMADEIPAQIGRNQPAALSHGEFVIPADVVSHMGNGNSDAGAKKLYQMMDKIRMARTGNKNQGKEINPDKFMPGGLAKAYAEGGSVQRYAGGGTTLPAGTTGTESSLSNWGGQYVTNMLGQGQALANMPYQAYMGPLTAGESPLQAQAFQNAGSLTTPAGIGQAATTAGGIATAAQGLNYAPTQFGSQYTAPAAYKPTTTDFTSDIAKSYMNPYVQQALDPQIAEARRQSQITQQQNAAKLTGAGAFGGSRQAIMDAENQRALGANLANITGTGYSTAYDKAMQQFNADQARRAQEAQFGAQQGMTSAQLGAQYGLAGQQAGEQSKQFGANYGLQGLQTGLQAAQTQGNLANLEGQSGLNNLNAMLTAGGQQRGIESEGIAADKAAFEEARANPYKMVQFQQSLLSGLPLAAQSYNIAQPSALSQAMGGATTVADLLSILTGQTAAKKV